LIFSFDFSAIDSFSARYIRVDRSLSSESSFLLATSVACRSASIHVRQYCRRDGTRHWVAGPSRQILVSNVC
jgi:hypothetical protein